MKKEKFVHEEGDVIVTVPQCIGCKHKDKDTCKLHGNITEDAYKHKCSDYEER